MLRCPFCGLELKKYQGRDYCLNCGFVDNEKEIDETKERDYIR